MKFVRLKRISQIIADSINGLIYKYNIIRGVFIEVPIVDLQEIGEKVYVFKEKSIEHFDFVKTYGFIEGGGYDIDYPEIDTWKIENAAAFYDSDFIITKNGEAAWPKYFYYNYSKNITTDYYFVAENDGKLTYRKPSKIIKVDYAFSLIGVFSHIWAHAIVEYFPKLSGLDIIANSIPGRLKVLVPEYKDTQLKRVMYDQLKKYNIDILVVHKGEAIEANTLYYMPRPTIFTDHETEITPGDQVLPVSVIDFIKNNLVNPYVKDIKLDPKYEKIFLPRRGGLGKGIINQDEIEEIFSKRGFYFLQPHKVNLEEKLKIFQSAKVVVGPFGSAFTNLFFCKPGTKVLIFTNFQRVFDYYFSAGQQFFGEDILFVTGLDDKRAINMSHCSYYLPPERVIAAANSLGIFDE